MTIYLSIGGINSNHATRLPPSPPSAKACLIIRTTFPAFSMRGLCDTSFSLSDSLQQDKSGDNPSTILQFSKSHSLSRDKIRSNPSTIQPIRYLVACTAGQKNRGDPSYAHDSANHVSRSRTKNRDNLPTALYSASQSDSL